MAGAVTETQSNSATDSWTAHSRTFHVSVEFIRDNEQSRELVGSVSDIPRNPITQER